MIKVKTAELNEMGINWLIVQILNMSPMIKQDGDGHTIVEVYKELCHKERWDATRNYSQGSPILDDEGVATRRLKSGQWVAMMSDDLGDDEAARWMLYTMKDVPRSASTSRLCRFEGKTRLIAGLRCVIAYHMGETVSIPDELA